ncbi:hypothetical protein [Terasakiella pusilla]|uniref:hypothetical protein n=1 Tax=Terasakiella pusilla TaxID=64973 RepID=UPI003AA7DC97
MTNQQTRTQVKRSDTNKTRAIVLSLPHFKLMGEIQNIYKNKYQINQISLSTMTRRALELLKAHLMNEQNIPLERGRTEEAKHGKLVAY